MVTFYTSSTRPGDGQWVDSLDFTWKLFAETTCFSLMCTDSDAKVTWRDKAFSKLGITMESQLLVMLYVLNNSENTESFGKKYVGVHSWVIIILLKLVLED